MIILLLNHILLFSPIIIFPLVPPVSCSQHTGQLGSPWESTWRTWAYSGSFCVQHNTHENTLNLVRGWARLAQRKGMKLREKEGKWVKRRAWGSDQIIFQQFIRPLKECVIFSFKMQYLRIIRKKLITLTEATNGKQMHDSNEPDMEKKPMKRFWQGKGAEHIQATLPLLLPLWDAAAKITTHTECNSQHCCLDASFKMRRKECEIGAANLAAQNLFPQECFIFLA